MSTARLDAVMDMSHQVWGEHEQEPGSMLVVGQSNFKSLKHLILTMRLVCGTPHFEKTLALAIRKCPWPSSTGMGNAGDMESRPLGRVDIQHASFRPEETSLSKSTWSRYKVGRYRPNTMTR
jgi:hypothetical protein